MIVRILTLIACGILGHTATATTLLRRNKTLECEFALSSSSGSRQVFAGHIRLPTELNMFVRIQQPSWHTKTRGWFFLVHGLLDSHRGYDEIAKQLLASGYGVVRMDVRGFARSIPDKIPSRIDFSVHVEDLKALLIHMRDHFGISRPRLVGHSMGGGLALALLADPEGPALVDERAIVISPYVYRLEYYAAEKMSNWGVLPNPLFALEKMIPRMMKIGPEYMMDVMVSEPQMRRAFNEFLDLHSAKRDFTSEENLKAVRSDLVQCAVATVKGLRDFHAIHALVQVPSSTQVDLAYGVDDALVEQQLTRKFGNAISSSGGEVFEMKAGHMLLEELPSDLVDILLKGKK